MTWEKAIILAQTDEYSLHIAQAPILELDAIAKIIFNSWKNVQDAILVLNTLIEELRIPLVGKQGSIESEVLAIFYKSVTVLHNLIAENK